MISVNGPRFHWRPAGHESRGDQRTECLGRLRRADILCRSVFIGPVSGSRYMARLRATGADWGLDTRIIF